MRTDIGQRMDRFCNRNNAYSFYRRHGSVGHLVKKLDQEFELYNRDIEKARKMRAVDIRKRIREEEMAKKKAMEPAVQEPEVKNWFKKHKRVT